MTPPRVTAPRKVLLVVGVGLAIAPFVLSTFRLELLAEVLIFALAAASLDLLVGYAGMPSLGHAAFVGLGAYVAGLGAIHWTGDALLGVLFAAVAGAIFGLATGALAVRTQGIYFLMLTLAFGELLASVALTWGSMTGGSNGLTGIPTPQLLGALTLDSPDLRYFYVLATTVLGFVVLTGVTRSPFGRSLVGIHQNEARMRSLGYRVERYKLAVFVLAGVFAAVAGAMHSQLVRFVSPSALALDASIFLLLMPLLGGAGRLWGAAGGALVVVFLRQELSSRFHGWELGLGILLLLVAYVGPHVFRRPSQAGEARTSSRTLPASEVEA